MTTPNETKTTDAMSLHQHQRLMAMMASGQDIPFTMFLPQAPTAIMSPHQAPPATMPPPQAPTAKMPPPQASTATTSPYQAPTATMPPQAPTAKMPPQAPTATMPPHQPIPAMMSPSQAFAAMESPHQAPSGPTSPHRALPATPRPQHQHWTNKQARTILLHYNVDPNFLSHAHIQLFALASDTIREFLIEQWSIILSKILAAAKVAYPVGRVHLDRQRAFRVCEAKHIEGKGLEDMVRGLRDLRMGSDVTANGTDGGRGQSTEGNSDATNEPDIDWDEYVTGEGDEHVVC